VKPRIDGGEANAIEFEASKRQPIVLEAATENQVVPTSPVVTSRAPDNPKRRPPPRVRKPCPRNDRCLAPTTDLEKTRKCLRETFGNTQSD
jgi:hypothetical protein